MRAIAMTARRWAPLRPPRLAERFDPRDNSFGVIRLTLAIMILVSHSWTLGFAEPSLGPLVALTGAQINSITLYGFFVVSGFLIAGSTLRSSVRRFVWRRAVRILPGFWVCLLITAFVIAPALALWQNGSLAGFWNHPHGPAQYVWRNWFASMDQYGISDLLDTTPYGRLQGGASVFNGALWSLKYELAWYAAMTVLIWLGAVRRHPWVIPAGTAVVYLVMVAGYLAGGAGRMRPTFPGAAGPLPLIGSFNVNQTVYLSLMFLLGATIRLYHHRIPVHGVLAAAAAVVLVASLGFGGFVVVGLPAYAYLIVYAAVAIPGWPRRVGVTHDYSYGIYLYAFPVEQCCALLGAQRWGLPAFLAISIAVTGIFAFASWHLVERPLLHRAIRRRAVPALVGPSS